MRSLVSLSVCVSLAIMTLALGGCASAQSEDQETSESAVVAASATDPVTYDNYGAHPAIQAVQDEVALIDSLEMQTDARTACSTTATKSLRDGIVRKVTVSSGEEGVKTEQEVYFRESGKLLFHFVRTTSLEDSTPGDEGSMSEVTENRTFFDEEGKVIFRLRRVGAGPVFTPIAGRWQYSGLETYASWYDVGCRVNELAP